MKKNEDYNLQDHQLSVSSLHHWLRLKRANQIDPAYRKVARRITLYVCITMPFRWLQQLILFIRSRSISFKENPPVFIIGHWRSGTTHMHYMLAHDKQFGYLENFQAFMFRIAFVTQSFMKPLLRLFMPSIRPSDNVKIDVHSPAEEEQPLANFTEKAGIHIFFFPRNRSYFDKYNLFKNITKAEKRQWQKYYLRVLKEIALYKGADKRLLLKNPFNTSRIKELLELFPDAKFIYVHRDPYEVYQSSKLHYEKTIKTQFLQTFSESEIKERILYCYETMLKKYLNENHLIPEENLVEVSYDDLLQKPVKTVNSVYEKLRLRGYKQAEVSIKKYIEKTRNYKTNRLMSISDYELERINQRWKFAFDHWGYEMVND
jgi:hypothetical protein